MRTGVYLQKSLPKPVASGGSFGVLDTLLHGIPANISYPKVFGCSAYLRLEDRSWEKFLRGRFVAYSLAIAMTDHACGFTT
jgi:hypothetical protein